MSRLSEKTRKKIDQLIAGMTLEEKVAQLVCKPLTGSGEEQLRSTMGDGCGTMSYMNSTLSGDNDADIRKLQDVQQFLTEKTRTHIPALAHSEGIAGAQIPGATTFPESIGLAATWDPQLAEEMGEAVAKEVEAYGIRAVHSPLFDLGQDPRWGRIGETYGENPYLVAQIGTAFVKGIQKDGKVMATAKHFLAYSVPQGGRNGGEVQLSERRLRDEYCFPFEAAIEDGEICAVMNAYGVLNDEPVVTSRRYMTDLLRGELGFEGPVVSDYGSVIRSAECYHTAADKKDAAVQAIKAGIDVEQPTDACYRYLPEAVRKGELDEKVIDMAVRRILSVKAELGLLDHIIKPDSTADDAEDQGHKDREKTGAMPDKPWAPVGDFSRIACSREHRELSRKIAEESIVLVKNNGILPLSEKSLKIAVIGPNADSKVNLFGGYSSVGTATTNSRDFDRSEKDGYLQMAYKAMISGYKDTLKQMGIDFEDQPSPAQKEKIMQILRGMMQKSGKSYQTEEEFLAKFYPYCRSVLEALEERFGKDHVIFAKGCALRKEISGGVEEAVQAAREADVVIAVLGGRESMRAQDATCGENKDNPNIGLEPVQKELMKAVAAVGKPIVSILIDGRPLAVPELDEDSEALVYAWLPAQEGAEAIADVITGTSNPCGRLPVTVLKDVSQIPMTSSELPLYTEPGTRAEYLDSDMNTPLYAFGHGLGYTTFSYSGLEVPEYAATSGVLDLQFTIANSGSVQGTETPQVYVSYEQTDTVHPMTQLAGFARVKLDPGRKARIHVAIDMKQLAYHDLSMQRVVSPGILKIMVGASSSDIRLRGECKVTGGRILVSRRVHAAEVHVETV